MSSQIIRMNPRNLPDAGKIGYSQISIADSRRLAFVSGQVAWRSQGEDIPSALADQTAIVIENLEKALGAIGSTPADIVQMRIYVTDLTPRTQEIVMQPLMSFLNGSKPSLTGIGVAALASPDLLIEIEMVVQTAG